MRLWDDQLKDTPSVHPSLCNSAQGLRHTFALSDTRYLSSYALIQESRLCSDDDDDDDEKDNALMMIIMIMMMLS
jgi:hypothetical protein